MPGFRVPHTAVGGRNQWPRRLVRVSRWRAACGFERDGVLTELVTWPAEPALGAHVGATGRLGRAVTSAVTFPGGRFRSCREVGWGTFEDLHRDPITGAPAMPDRMIFKGLLDAKALDRAAIRDHL